MKTLKLTGKVDEQHRLTASVPADVPPGIVDIVVTLSGSNEDDAGAAWMQGVAGAWSTELSDPREDLYTLSDGEPVDGSR